MKVCEGPLNGTRFQWGFAQLGPIDLEVLPNRIADRSKCTRHKGGRIATDGFCLRTTREGRTFLMPLSKQDTQGVDLAVGASSKIAGGVQNAPLRDATRASVVQNARRRLTESWSLFQLTPFDVSTEGGRSKERYRRALLTTLALGVSKGAAILTVLVSIRFAVRYLGTERFGMWMTVTSFTTLLQFADLGIGNGLLTAISEAHGRDDRVAAGKYVSSAFFLLLGIAVLVLAVFAMLYRLIPWPRIFNVASMVAMEEAGPAVTMLVVCFALNMPLDIVQRVQMGYQEGFVTYLWQAAGSLIGLLGVLLVIHFQGGLPLLVLALSGGPVFAVLLNWIVEFGWSSPWLLPKWRCSDSEAVRRILGMGVLFVILQLAASLAFSSDNIVIAQILGSSAVTQYAVPMRLFALIGTGAALFLTPLWPAYGEAIARGELPWVRRTLVRSLWMTLLICGISAICMVILGRPILRLWVGPLIQPPFLLLLGMGIWTVLTGLGTAAAMFLNGANLLRFQVVSAVLMATSALVAKIFLGHVSGLPGIIWGSIVAYFICTTVPFAVYIPKLLEKLNQSINPMQVNGQCR